ncbi:hypothetical protein SAMN04515671_0912 [Nakamurella panacisegetis]|uniref:Uncharacterized protein n=1 Tax=Nakamurella panacisegetis TaxID=1090615 RepID=A0A1H0JGZ6_9ACTN|nr:hypothetical protein [Nakamurella panacisegetis]SDO43048.1 hypothetical protein SAMN04515671_0912 [Nakamurella panacisegetis]
MPIPVNPVPMASLARMDLGISMLVPLGWGIDGDESRIRLLGPLEDGRRPTFTLLQGEPEADGEPWFTEFRELAVARIAATAKGFVKLSVEDFVLSSFVDVTALHYRRDEPDPVSQLQAYLWASSSRMLVADAATARAHEARDLPIFDAILRSIRLLPI